MVGTSGSEPDRRVLMQFVSGPFRVLEGLWTLTPLGELGCRVELEMRFEFALLGRLVQTLVIGMRMRVRADDPGMHERRALPGSRIGNCLAKAAIAL